MERTTIEAISESSGVAKTTIYRHWSGKAPLVMDAFESMMAAPVVPDYGSLLADLSALAEGLAAALRHSAWADALPSLIDAAERDPGLADLHRRMAGLRHEGVREILRRARDRGEITGDITDDEIIDLIAGPLFYHRLVGHAGPDPALARRIAVLVHRLAGEGSS